MLSGKKEQKSLNLNLTISDIAAVEHFAVEIAQDFICNHLLYKNQAQY